MRKETFANIPNSHSHTPGKVSKQHATEKQENFPVSAFLRGSRQQQNKLLNKF